MGTIDANDPNLLLTDWVFYCPSRQGIPDLPRLLDFTYIADDDSLSVDYGFVAIFSRVQP